MIIPYLLSLHIPLFLSLSPQLPLSDQLPHSLLFSIFSLPTITHTHILYLVHPFLLLSSLFLLISSFLLSFSPFPFSLFDSFLLSPFSFLFISTLRNCRELERASCMSLASKVTFESYVAGSEIFKVGQTATKFYIILQGETKVNDIIRIELI